MEQKTDIKELVRNFISDTNRTISNVWITTDELQIYLRKAIHSVGGEIIRTIDIANVSLVNQEDKGKGYFKEVILFIESFELPVYVENVGNMELAAQLVKHGYVEVDTRCGGLGFTSYCKQFK